MRKRGSVKAEKSLSAVELSGRVQKRGYLVKQVHKTCVTVLIEYYTIKSVH